MTWMQFNVSGQKWYLQSIDALLFELCLFLAAFKIHVSCHRAENMYIMFLNQFYMSWELTEIVWLFPADILACSLLLLDKAIMMRSQIIHVCFVSLNAVTRLYCIELMYSMVLDRVGWSWTCTRSPFFWWRDLSFSKAETHTFEFCSSPAELMTPTKMMAYW